MFIVKRVIKWVVSLLILVFLVLGVYYVFIKCDQVNALLDREFTLNVMDYAVIDDDEDSLKVKLIGITNNQCSEDECNKTNEILVKLAVYNSHHFSYIKLGKNSNPSEKISKNKMKYTIMLVDATEDGKVTLKVIK